MSMSTEGLRCLSLQPFRNTNHRAGVVAHRGA